MPVCATEARPAIFECFHSEIASSGSVKFPAQSGLFNRDSACLFLVPISVLNLESVPHAPNGLNVLGLSGILLDLLADLFDMNRNGGDVTDGVHIPDLSK